MPDRVLVVTTINAPTKAMRELAEGCVRLQAPFFVIGDAKTPDSFDLPGARFFSLKEQHKLFPELRDLLPINHYARKNLGYLLAMRERPAEIQETDDDNVPGPDFWEVFSSPLTVDAVQSQNPWFNVYSLFADEDVWPRGFPLEYLQAANPSSTEPDVSRALILAGLADEDPDVDAIFRLTRRLPIRFRSRRPVMLRPGTWCPFNSQNTVFRREAFPLLYLPVHCSVRMTDIWRSFVAQRCLWETGEGVVFHGATVFQERNRHNLLQDFQQEIPGYLANEKIRQVLSACQLRRHDLPRNLVICYEALSAAELISQSELASVAQWSRMVERL